MASCSHKNHKVDSVKYRIQRKTFEMMNVDMGWNPIKRNWELCDSGMIADYRQRNNRTRPHSTPKKKKNNRNESED